MDSEIRSFSPPPTTNIECKEKLCWHCDYRGVTGICGKHEICLLFRDLYGDYYSLKMNQDFCLLRCKACLEWEKEVETTTKA
jgi:hypothetical protein